MVKTAQQEQRDYLNKLADNNNFVKLVRYIRNHEREGVRFGAAGILSETIERYKRHVTDEQKQALIQSALNDPSDQVRGKVLTVLMYIDEETIDNILTRFAANPENLPNDVPYPLVLTRWESSNDAGLRYIAVAGFGRVGSASSIEKIQKMVEKGENKKVLQRSLKECRSVGDAKFVDCVQECMRKDAETFSFSCDKQDLQTIRELCVDALVEIGTDAAYEALVTASRGRDEELKQYVLSEIGKFGVEDTVDVIVSELDGRGDDLRSDAAQGVINTFSETPMEDSGAVREQAIEMIVDDIDSDVSDVFSPIVRFPDSDVERRNAAWLMGQIQCSEDEAVESLTETLACDDEYSQKIAAGSLIQIDSKEVRDEVESLMELSQEGSEAYRMAEFVMNNIEGGAEEAKKDMVEYTYVSDPTDYTSSR